MKKGTRLAIPALVLALSLGVLGGCASNDSQQSTTTTDDQQTTQTDATTTEAPTEITVVGTGSFYPVIYTDDNGNLTGFEHDLIEEIAKRENLKVTWELSDDYGAMFSGLDSGRYDTIAAQISWTEKRAETYNFSDKYCANEIKLCVRADDPAQSVDDLQGRKVCVEFGTVIGDYFENYNATHPADQQIELTITEGNIYDELAIGHYDAFPITVLSYDAVMEKGDYDFKLIGDPLIVDYQAFPFAKTADPALIEKFNDAIQSMKDDGSLAQLSQKYYGHDFVSSIPAE